MKMDGLIGFVGKNRQGKRLLSPEEIVQMSGQSPIHNIMRNALKAEKLGDHSTAVRGWSEIQGYIAPKRKPIDPTESALKGKQVATLEELMRIKTAILAGTVAAIDESTVMEGEPAIRIEHKPKRDPSDFI